MVEGLLKGQFRPPGRTESKEDLYRLYINRLVFLNFVVLKLTIMVDAPMRAPVFPIGLPIAIGLSRPMWFYASNVEFKDIKSV